MRTRLIATIAALCLAAPACASANGDPASDVLLQAKVYFPTTRVTPEAANNIKSIVQAANAKGYPIRVALIHDIADLGVVQDLLNQPQKYAEFLGPEIRFAYKGDLLVVMPGGMGLVSTDETPPPAKAIAGMKVEAGGSPDGLAQTAGEAVTALAAAAGHPIATQSKGGSSGGTIAAVLVAIALVALGIGGAIWVRRDQAKRPPAADEPPAAP